MKLNELGTGQSASIVSVGGKGALRQHFLDMGVIPGAIVTMVKLAPLGDPMEVRIHGYELTLRLADAEKIEILPVDEVEQLSERTKKREQVKHPGLGETGIFHTKADGNPLPDSELLTFALAGNQNSGKTTLFNQLTGSNQRVGNFPGVTVDRKDGVIRGHSNTLVTDLPGIYSMSPYSNEELVTRQFLLQDKPKGIINIVDATNIERNLYLTMQLMELNIPMVLALNMMDEVRKNGGSIHINEMENRLGIPVVPIAASKNEGIQELVDHAIHVAKNQERPGRMDFCDPEHDNGAVHRCLHAIIHLIEDHARQAQIPLRFAASKVAEGDEEILKALDLNQNELELLDHIIQQMEEERGLDHGAAIADMRFKFIKEICDATVVKPKESKEYARSVAIDNVLTGKFTAIPAFVGIMSLVFWLTFGVIGTWLADILDMGITWLSGVVDLGLTAYGINPVVHSLIIDGIFAGVAFVMDKLLRKIGLSGRSIVPMLIGFGCSVPGVMASRTLPSERDRKMTILLTPFMSCSAKLPIYALFTAAFFPRYGALVMIGLYFTGIVVGILFALLLKGTMFKGEPVPFVMELPNYRMPGFKNVGQLLWDKAKDFITRAFTVIFVATIIIWFLQYFDPRLNVVSDSQDSLLALVSGMIAPIFVPLGFGDWRISTALITGFMAKESVVSTLTVLLGGSAASLSSMFTPFSAIVFLVFTLLYTPCVATIASVKRELGGKWAVGVVVIQCVIAWVVALLVNLFGIMIGWV
ncbi:FeoB small GTPase domain-containing protein [Desulfitobacterium sp. PCE1]|uniref:FeoB small GTPase domain-containing protein n=1 Tax=Desulfitobacterium sp. PCE1 TaxID=146907 RepID=UPI00037E8439|nr:FeoB small GTPase domain-containing protein [Desulfitobacterium sp. PCE1]